MYSEASISLIANTVGWNTPVNAPGVTVDAVNLITTSGRRFFSFHALALSENVFSTAGDIPLTSEQFNTLLGECRTQGAIETLQLVFDKSTKYDTAKDYDSTVLRYAMLLSEVFGFVVTANAMELMLTSKRVNDDERKIKYGMLKTELDGFRNEQGIQISSGIKGRLYSAVKKAQHIIFPESVEIYGSSQLW